MGFNLFRQEINLEFCLTALTELCCSDIVEKKEEFAMPYRHLWIVVVYMLVAPFAAALTSCLLHRGSDKLRLKLVLTVGILGLGLLVSAIMGIDSVLSIFSPAIPIFCLILWFSAHLAVECVKKKAAGELRKIDIVVAVGFYFALLVIVFIITPVPRWCEGCMEFH